MPIEYPIKLDYGLTLKRAITTTPIPLLVAGTLLKGKQIQSWMYIAMSAFKVVECRPTLTEKEEVLNLFWIVGQSIKIGDLPKDFKTWKQQRKRQLEKNFKYSEFTKDLFTQYQKHLGHFRYQLLLEIQILLAPKRIKELLNFRDHSMLVAVIPLYRLRPIFKIYAIIKEVMLAKAYKSTIKVLDHLVAHH